MTEPNEKPESDLVADRDPLDLSRSLEVEQEVLDTLDEPSPG
jgi:hypothetical protein